MALGFVIINFGVVNYSAVLMTDFLLENFWLIPIYSLIGALITLPWSLGIVRQTGPRPAAYINILMTVVGFIHGSIIFNLI